MSQTIPPQPIGRRDLLSSHRMIRNIMGIIGVMAVIGILVWEVLRVTAPPTLNIVSPTDSLLTTSHRIVLEGTAAAGAAVTANGVPVGVTLDGKFKENLDLRTGANIITIVASKKFAKPHIIYRRVVVTE